MPLASDQQTLLTTAEGYAELGLFLEANNELENLDPFLRHLPEVLIVRLQIYTGLEKWELAEAVAMKLVHDNPMEPQWWISLAYATRRCKSVESAKAILQRALEHHPREPMIHYNLACYECRSNDLEAAKERLSQAFTLRKSLRALALEDDDLEGLWNSL